MPNHESSTGTSRNQLRQRISDLVDQGHTDRLRYAWPADTPTLKYEGHTRQQLEAILAAIRQVETDTGAQWHPDDTPSTDPQPRRHVKHTANPQPIDEGRDADPDRLEALKTAFGKLTTLQMTAVKEIAEQANAAGRSISVSAKPSVRRFEIARALVRWASGVTPPDQVETVVDSLFESVADIATPEQTADPDLTLGALIGSFTIEQAERLADTYSVAGT